MMAAGLALLATAVLAESIVLVLWALNQRKLAQRVQALELLHGGTIKYIAQTQLGRGGLGEQAFVRSEIERLSKCH